MEVQRSFTFLAVDGADVRLKSGGSSLTKVEIKAPVRSGKLHIVDSIATINLVLALDKLKTGNFFTEAAARTFIGGYNAHDLVFQGSGTHNGNDYDVSGNAQAGELDVEISLTITAVANSPEPEVELVGSAAFGRVHIPLPGIGTVENLIIDIDARLTVSEV